MTIREVEKLNEGHESWERFRKTRGVEREEWFNAVPKRPNLDNVKFVEDEVVVMPLHEDGVVALGDLFNIKTGKNVGSSLIHYNKLSTEYLVAHPRKDLEYKFDFISDHIDLIENLKVEACLKIDVISSWTVTIEGKAIYDSKKSRKFWEDEIRCTYRNETFSLVLLPTAFVGPNPIINMDILERLAGPLEATHVCTEMILGGETNAFLYFKKDDNIDTRHIFGELNLNISNEKKTINIEAFAQLTMDNNETSKHLDQRIYVYSKPPFETQPNTVEEMLSLIKNLPANVEKEQHYKMFKEPDYPKVTGVPLRFKLTPIGQVIDLPESYRVRKTFRVISQAVVNQFIVMLATLRDFQSKEFVKRKIYERDFRLLTMLQDQDNPVTMRISAWETELSSKAKDIQNVADVVYQAYKKQQNEETGEEELVTEEDLREVITNFNETFSVVKIYQEIEDFRRECKKEIVGIHLSDVDDDVVVHFLTNELDMEDFYGSERRMRILLHTSTEDGDSPVGTFLKLFNLSAHLKTLGADVGVAYPGISSGFKLMMKTNAVESIYTGDDIPFALEMLGLAVGKAENVPKLFWTVNGALTGIRLPLQDNISDIPSLIAVNRELQDVKVCPTYLTLREEISKKDGRLKIVLDVTALESVGDSIVFFRRLRSELEKEPGFIAVDWAVGTFDMGKSHDAPVAFVFLDSVLMSVCLDNLDVLLLLEQLRTATPDFEMLKAERLRQQCMYPERGTYGMQVAELLGQYHGSMTDAVEELTSFAPKELLPVPYVYIEKFTLEDAIVVNRELVSGDTMNVLSAVGAICIKNFPEMLTSLKTMGWNEAANGFKLGLRTSSWLQVSAYLFQFLEKVNPLLAKADYVRKKLDAILETEEEIEDKVIEDIDKSIVAIKNEPDCPEELKDALDSYKNSNKELKLKGYQETLTKFVEKEYSEPIYFNLRHLMNFVATMIGAEGNTSNRIFEKFIPDTVGLYIERVLDDKNLECFPGVQKKLKEHLDNKNFYQTLSLLSKTKYDHRLFMVHQYLYLLLDFTDADTIKKLVSKMGNDSFEHAHYEDLWKNKKFEYYMKQGVNSQSVIEGIATYQCPSVLQEDGKTYLPQVPDYIPIEFHEKLIPLLIVEDDLNFEWAQDWKSIQEFLGALRTFSVRKAVPKHFVQIFQENMINPDNAPLRQKLEEIGVLYFWDATRQLFLQPWDLTTISKAIEKIITYHDAGPFDEARAEMKLLAAQEKPTIEEPSNEKWEETEQLTVCDSWKAISKTIVGSKLGILDYHTLSEILPTPVIVSKELDNAMEKILPYIIQRTKFLSNNPLLPKTVREYIRYPKPKNVKRPGVIDWDDETPGEERLPMVSRGDILTYLFNCTEPVVAKNVIQLLGNYPNLAFPLIVQNIDSTISGENYKLLYPQLKNIPIRWEVRPGEIVENHLFTNPFRLTVVVRLGDAEKGLGKSPILNSVMASSSMFSSIKDKDSNPNLGRPISHPGMVEVTYLTKSTCKDTLWKKLMDSYYLKLNYSGYNDVLLLANLHGDALKHANIVRELSGLGAQFLVLIMPDTWTNVKQKIQDFTKLLGEDNEPLLALVDPTASIDTSRFSDESVITTEDILAKKTTVLEGLLLESYDTLSIPNWDSEVEHSGFIIVQDTERPESRHLVNLMKNLSVKTVRQILKLIDVPISSNDEMKSFVQHWNENLELRDLLEAYMSILRLPTNVRDGAISHIQQEMAILSTASSMKSRSECIQLIDELKESVNAEIPIVDEIRNLHNQVKALKIWIDDRTLGLEHFFRAMACAHEIQSDLPSIVYTKHFAEHILNGNEVEIFNRDAGNIFWSKWMKETLLKEMPQGFENSRVFVVSIVGLISSGKSTLLNALFGSKFSVSIGGGTCGIFMKLVFLEEKLREKLKVDIIILLDTQGISTIGNVGDEETLQREQQLVAFTIGLSNLTMMNIQGRKLGNLSNVLETVFAKLTTIEQLSFIPDFLLLHHHSNHRIVQSEIAIMELTIALRNVSDLTEKKELDLGVRERIGRRLNKIMRRVKHRDIAHQISPMYTKKIGAGSGISKAYHNDVVQLYEKILETVQDSDKIMTFGDWYAFSENLWKDLTCHKDNFPLRFSNSEKLEEYLELQTKISGVREIIDLAFQSHDAGLKAEIAKIDPKQVETLIEEVEPKISPREDRRKLGLNKINTALRKMAGTCERVMETEDQAPCQPCLLALQEKEALIKSLKGSNYRFETQEALNDYIVSVRLSIWNQINQSLIAWEIKQEGDHPNVQPTLNYLYNQAKIELGGDPLKIQRYCATQTTIIPAQTQILNEVTVHYKNLPHLIARVENINHENPLTSLGLIKAFDLDYYNAIKVFELEIPEEEEEEVVEGEEGENEDGGDEVDFGCDKDPEKLAYLDWAQQDWLEAQIKDIPELMWQGRNHQGVYKVGLIRDFKTRLSKILVEFEERTREKLLPTFKWEAHIFGIVYYINYMKEKQDEWDLIHQPLLVKPFG